MTRKTQMIIIAFCTALLLGGAVPGGASGNEFMLGYNPDYGLMVGVEVWRS